MFGNSCVQRAPPKQPVDGSICVACYLGEPVTHLPYSSPFIFQMPVFSFNKNILYTCSKVQQQAESTMSQSQTGRGHLSLAACVFKEKSYISKR